MQLRQMSATQKKVLWLTLLLSVFSVFGLIVVTFRKPRTAQQRASGSPLASLSMSFGQDAVSSKRSARRNLQLQAASSNLSRRLGKRFAPDQREQSLLVATLSVGGEQKIVRIARKQTDRGEQVLITTEGSQNSLSWRGDQGALSAGKPATGKERELIEHLVLDSPDEFVLAQLRGASYYTVATNVRPAGAGDSDEGPRWNIVRVDDPNRDPERRPQSSWRLYYLNAETGLIDRIVSQVRGETVEANLSDWTNSSGERVPAQITWTRQGKTIMQYRLTNFSHSRQ